MALMSCRQILLQIECIHFVQCYSYLVTLEVMLKETSEIKAHTSFMVTTTIITTTIRLISTGIDSILQGPCNILGLKIDEAVDNRCFISQV